MLEFGFSEKNFQKAKEIIYFVGYAQDLAWSKEEGVLQKDIQIDKSLLDYLKQGILKQYGSRYLFLITSLGILILYCPLGWATLVT